MEQPPYSFTVSSDTLEDVVKFPCGVSAPWDVRRSDRVPSLADIDFAEEDRLNAQPTDGGG